MATVIYKPQDASLGGSLGEGFGKGILHSLQKREEQEKVQKAKAFYEGIQKAAATGGRPAALEAAIGGADLFEDPDDFKAAISFVDKVAPLDDLAPVTALGPDNKQQTKFVPRQQLGRMNTPEGIREMFGEGFTVGGRPEDEEEFFRPGAEGQPPTSLGKAPISKRPLGAQTGTEIQLGRQIAADRRAAEDQQLQRDAAARAEAREKRLVAAAERQGQPDVNQLRDNFRADMNSGRQALMQGLGKTLPDGSFDFIGEDERKLFQDRFELFSEMLEAEHATAKGVVNYGKLVSKAVKAHPGKAKDEGGTAPGGAKKPEEKKPGVVERLNEGARGINERLGLSKPKAQQNLGQRDLPHPKTVQERDSLPKGTIYIDPNGVRRVRK